jgi:hypothetical protein
VLGPKLEGLPDNQLFNPKCLFQLSQLFESVGNCAEYRRLLACTLELWRERGDDLQVAVTLRFLAYVNWRLSFLEEGILYSTTGEGIIQNLQADQSHIGTGTLFAGTRSAVL